MLMVDLDDVPSRLASERQRNQLSVINLDDIIWKVVYTEADTHKDPTLWFTEHTTLTGFGFWDDARAIFAWYNQI